MLIKQKRIRSLKGRVAGRAIGSEIVIAARLVPDLTSKLTRIGFTPAVSVGEVVLPARIGPISRFNADGGWMVHKHLPKETAYRTVEWHWQEFCGRYDTKDRSRIIDVPYERYPRTRILPPSIELKITMTADGQRALVAPQMRLSSTEDQAVIHVVNLFLELIGYCQVTTSTLGEIIQADMRRLNWTLLPPGQRTWKELRPNVLKVIKNARGGNQPVIEHRLEAINSYSPDFVAIGHAGFAGYVVFGFTDRNLYILESIYSGNATYVFGDDWETLSQFSKSQILDEDLQQDRIIHRQGWERRLRQLLRTAPGRPR